MYPLLVPQRMGRIKRILRLCLFEFFEKGEGRCKRIQAVSLLFFWKREKRDTKIIQAISPLFFWKREKRETKRIQAVSPWRILFGKGRRDEKMNTTSFQGLEKPENFRKLLVQRRRRSSKRFKACKGL